MSICFIIGKVNLDHLIKEIFGVKLEYLHLELMNILGRYFKIMQTYSFSSNFCSLILAAISGCHLQNWLFCSTANFLFPLLCLH